MAGGIITSSDFLPLMADGLRMLYEEETEKYPLSQWMSIYNELDSERQFEVELGLIGMGLPSFKAELSRPRVDQPQLGRPVKYRNYTYALETGLSLEAKNDDRYGKLARMIVPEMTRNFKILKEYQAASLFVLGFNTQGYEPDGVSFFNTAHPLILGGGTTSSNRNATDAALSVTALGNLRTILRKTRSESNKLQPLTANLLVVGPSNITLADEITKSSLKPGQFPGGTQPNDINVFQQSAGTFPLTPITWDYLDETVNPGAYYLGPKDKAESRVKMYLREKLTPDTDYDKGARVLKFFMFTRYSLGFSDWRGWSGSRGS